MEHGARGLTISAVATRSGVARATVYRRYPTREALVGAAARAATAGRTIAASGDIAGDLEAGAAIAQRIFDSPVFVAVLPELVRGLVAEPPTLDFNLLGPGRPGLTQAYREHGAEQGFDPSVPPTLPYDMVAGTLLGHLIATGKPASPAYARKVAEVAIRGLRKGGEPAG